MTDINTKWVADMRRYETLLRTMERLGVLDEVYNYVSVTPPSASKYGEKHLTDTVMGSLAADIKAGTVSIPVIAAIIRVQLLWSDGFFGRDAMSMVDDYVRSYRDRIQRNYLDAPGGVCYEPSQGGHAP